MARAKRKEKPKQKAEPKKMGRPRTVIDWDRVARMCRIQCTGPEIASVLGIHNDTLTDAAKRDHGVTFSEWAAVKREGGKQSLRRRQWQVANKGNVAMLIWLGKQWLGQADKPANSDGDDLRGESRTFTVRLIDDTLAAVEPANDAENE